MRTLFAFTIALLAVVAVAPDQVMPWKPHLTWARPEFRPLVAGIISSGLLCLAAWLLPVPTLRVTNRWRGPFLGVGLLLLLQPWLHLALLASIAWRPSPRASDLVVAELGMAEWTMGRLGLMLLLALVAPVAEEWFFRGRLLPLVARKVGPRSAVTLTALAFAVAHGNPLQAMVALPVGLLLGWLRLTGHGLPRCILVHQVHNMLFLVAGPAFITVPWVGMLTAVIGVVMLWLAALTAEPRPWPRAWSHLAALALMVVLAAAAPLHRRVQDVLWVDATHRAIERGPIPDVVMAVRLDQLRQQGRLSGGRGEALVAKLLQQPPVRSDRLAMALVVVDPQAFAAWATTPTAHTVEHLILLSDFNLNSPALGEAFRACLARRPTPVVQAMVEEPEVIRRFLHLPDDAAVLRAALAGADGPGNRTRLLNMVERERPGQVADVLFTLPTAAIGPAERRFLFMRYPDANDRLERLARTDPVRAAAFRVR